MIEIGERRIITRQPYPHSQQYLGYFESSQLHREAVGLLTHDWQAYRDLLPRWNRENHLYGVLNDLVDTGEIVWYVEQHRPTPQMIVSRAYFAKAGTAVVPVLSGASK